MSTRNGKQTARKMKLLAALRPRTEQELHRFVQAVFGLNVPRQSATPGSAAPFAYLAHSFYEGQQAQSAEAQRSAPADVVVWANRGGGKTLLGAVATLLDLLFKPGVQVRILGGSLEQSSRMYEHLVALCDRPMVKPMLAGEPTQRSVRLINGSRAAILAQSQRSVRGVRVHKLRCDEVEEFDPQVWAAAQLVTRSGWCGEHWVNGTVEALSTMHRPFGLMNQLVTQRGGADSETGTHVFRWNVLDVIERCPPERACDTCLLWRDCQGIAKQADGFMKIDDLVAQRRRTSDDAWAAEMLCQRPRRSDSVYPNFDMKRHVQPFHNAAQAQTLALVGGMDFGLRSPLVMIWAVVQGEVLHVVDEYVQSGRTLEQHIEALRTRLAERVAAGQLGSERIEWVGVDPAGRQRNSHSGVSDIEVLKAHGYRVRARPSAIRDGIERLRRRLDHDTLRIDPRCVQLAEAMSSYHFDLRHPERNEPVKDGPDHACDALRYLVINLEQAAQQVRVESYV